MRSTASTGGSASFSPRSITSGHSTLGRAAMSAGGVAPSARMRVR